MANDMPSIRGLDAVILPDNDDPGRQHAAMVAKSLNGIAKQVRTLTLPDLPEKGDVADWIAAGGTRERLEELVEALVQPEQPDPPHHEDDLETAIARLAALPVTRYELVRQDEAKRLKVRATFLDKMVAAARSADDAQDDQQGRPLNLPVPEPWPEPVNGAQLLTDLTNFFATMHSCKQARHTHSGSGPCTPMPSRHSLILHGCTCAASSRTAVKLRCSTCSKWCAAARCPPRM